MIFFFRIVMFFFLHGNIMLTPTIFDNQVKIVKRVKKTKRTRKKRKLQKRRQQKLQARRKFRMVM